MDPPLVGGACRRDGGGIARTELVSGVDGGDVMCEEGELRRAAQAEGRRRSRDKAVGARLASSGGGGRGAAEPADALLMRKRWTQ